LPLCWQPTVFTHAVGTFDHCRTKRIADFAQLTEISGMNSPSCFKAD
jgi:hypothetical protein